MTLLGLMEERREKIAGEFKEIEKQKADASQLTAEYEAKLSAAAAEAGQMLAEAKLEAERAKDKVVTEAREAADRERQRAIADIQAAKDQAVRELAQKSVDSAITLAGNLAAGFIAGIAVAYILRFERFTV